MNDSNAKRRGFVGLLLALLDMLRAWLGLLAHIGDIFGVRRRRERPWRLRIGRRDRQVKLSDAEVNRLLQRHRDLKDVQKIAALAGQFRVPESDFFADPNHVDRLMRRFLEENPPWLHLSKVLEGSESGSDRPVTETLYRELETREVQDVTLFVPDESWRDRPLASLTMRPARGLNEVWQARLLDQVLPPEVILDRCNRGEILIPVRNAVHQRLEFQPEDRTMELTVRKRVPISIDMEGEAGKGGQLLYVLLDYSASMQGKSAALAMAVIAATLRANMGHRNARYLYRRYAEEMWPLVVEPPIQAITLREKDALLDLILSTNFVGSATHVNDAIEVAIADIKSLRREESLEASILLVTDGRAEIWESTALHVRGANVKIHAVMVTPEKNPSLEAICESFTALDIGPDQSQREDAPAIFPESRPRQAFRI